jgi:hypothetical protein
MATLQTLLFQQAHASPHRPWREHGPLLSNYLVLLTGGSTLLRGRGFKDIYSKVNSAVHSLGAGFQKLTLQF